MCRLALKTADTPFSPYEVLTAMEAMQEGYDGSGLGLLLRSTAGALVSALALLLVLPLVLGNLPYDVAQALAQYLPGAGAMFLVFGAAPGESMSDTSARLILLAWAGGSVALGGWRLLRTDASR